MNCKDYNIIKSELDASYYLSIRDNDTDIFKEIYLTAKEFMILDVAVRHNKGIINLLSNFETICGLFNKGLITISNDDSRLIMVSDVMLYVLSPKLRIELSDNRVNKEDKSNGFFKFFGNESVCLCSF